MRVQSLVLKTHSVPDGLVFIRSYFYTIFRRMWAVPSNVVFCRSCNQIFAWMSSKYFLFPSLMTPRAPIAIDIVVVFILYVLSILISRSVYFDSFFATPVEMFLSIGIAVSIGRQLIKRKKFFQQQQRIR